MVVALKGPPLGEWFNTLIGGCANHYNTVVISAQEDARKENELKRERLELQEAEEKMHELDRFKYMLKLGYVVIKHTIGAISGKPKLLRRILWLDATETRLCISNKLGNATKSKGVDLGDILEVRDGSATAVFESTRPEKENLCFSLICEDRSFDLEIPPEVPSGSDDRSMLVDNLKLLILYRVMEAVTERELREEEELDIVEEDEDAPLAEEVVIIEHNIPRVV